MKGYLANGLFSIGDRLVNKMIAKVLRSRIKGLDLYVPQENEALNDKSQFADSITIAKGDTEHLLQSDFLVAVIDGVEIDSGVSAEIGMFSTTGRPIFALYSDVRQQGRDNPQKIEALIKDGTENQFFYRNLFVVGLIKLSGGGIYSSIEDLVDAVEKFAKENDR
jgi:nucleoside 2-deoxyribosyltransferase